MANTVLACTACALAAAGALHAPAARAAYPDRPVRVVLPYAAGGPTDIAARLVAAELTTKLGQSFYVDNRAGAGGNVGAEFAAKATPDGYTLFVIGAAHAINKTLYKHLAYDVQRDFVPVATFSSAPLILLANPTLPVSGVSDLVALAKSRRGVLNYCSAGTGTAPHLEMEAMKAATGIDVVHVPYKGSAPGLADLMAGTVQLCFDSVVVWQQYSATGKLKALAVTSPARAAIAPDVPTMAQAGYPQLEASVWYGLAAPAGTPQAIVKLLNERIRAILAEPPIVQRLHALGSEPLVKTPEQFRVFMDAEVANWGRIVRQAGASVD